MCVHWVRGGLRGLHCCGNTLDAIDPIDAVDAIFTDRYRSVLK